MSSNRGSLDYALALPLGPAALAGRPDQTLGFHRPQHQANHLAAHPGAGSFDCRNGKWQATFYDFGPDSIISTLKGANEDQNHGITIALRAMESPQREIVTNCSKEPSVVLNNVKQGTGSYGYNAATDEYGDMIAMGILGQRGPVREADILSSETPREYTTATTFPQHRKNGCIVAL